MAEIFSNGEEDKALGSLLIERDSAMSRVFIVSKENENRTILKEALDYDSIDELDTDGVERWHLLDIHDNGFIEIFPFRNWEVKYFLPKYGKLISIGLDGFGFDGVTNVDEIEELISNFPKALVKTHAHGLGFKKEYAVFVRQLEELGICHLVISKRARTEINVQERKCTIKNSEFEEIRKSMDRVTRHAQKVSNIIKGNASYNTFCFFLKNESFPQKPLSLEDDSTLAKIMAKASPIIGAGIDRAEKKEALDFVAENAMKVLKQEPERLLKLKNDIELATLEELIGHFEKMLDDGRDELSWQRLFNENPFILNMAFGYPVIKIQGQASVGGRKFSGDGDKITDFLVKNNLSNNLALFEIKKPGARLLAKKSYREGILGPSSELTGSVNQMLDQKSHIQRNILSLKDNSKVYDLETFAVHGVLVIGRSPLDFNEQKSFELYRGNSKDIAIVTFDELLEKLKQLYLFIRG